MEDDEESGRLRSHRTKVLKKIRIWCIQTDV